MSEPIHTHSGGTSLESLKAMATKKIGPLPALAWAAIVVGAVVVYRVYKARKGAATTTTANPTGAFTDSTMSSSDGGDAPSGDSGSTVTPTGVDQSNATYAANVTNWLIGQGVDPTTASNAVAAYINGNQLSPTQDSLINKVLAQFGAPPGGVIPISVAPVSGTTQTPKPVTTPTKTPPKTVKPPTKVASKPAPPKKPVPKSVTYTVRSGDTLSSIASRYNTTWQKLYAANRSVIGGNPNLIRPGERLRIV